MNASIAERTLTPRMGALHHRHRSMESLQASGDAGAQAGHDRTFKAGSQAADTASDGTHTQPFTPIMPSRPARHPKYDTQSGGSIAHPASAGHGSVAANSAKLAEFSAS
jgi:hypothetical protein